MNKKTVSTALILFLFALGCNNVEGPDYDNGGDQPALKATFSSIQQNVFAKSCAFSNCHGGTQEPNLNAGSAYNNLVNKPSIQRPSMMRVKPGDSANSYIMKKLNGDGTSVMPPSGKLAQATIDTVAAWIDRGALKN